MDLHDVYVLFILISLAISAHRCRNLRRENEELHKKIGKLERQLHGFYDEPR